MNNAVRYVVGALFLAMVGCAGLQKGIGVVSYDKGTQPILAKATADGEYSLYASTDTEPKVSYFLRQGEPLGFKYGKTGEIIAVGGTAENAVPDGDYIWKRRDVGSK